MSQALLTATFTLIGGIFLFLISEFIRGYIVKPSIKLREHIGTIIDRVIFFQNHLMNSTVKEDVAREMSIQFRSAATQLRAKAYTVLWFEFCARIKIVPSKANIESASRQLIGLSNGTTIESWKVVDKEERTFKGDIEQNRKYIEELGHAIGFEFRAGSKK